MEIVKLGEVARFIRGITFKPEDLVTPHSTDSIVCMRTKNVQFDIALADIIAIPPSFVRRKEQILQKGDLIVSTANSWNLVGKASWVPDLPYRATAGGFISILRGNELIDARYLYHWVTYSKTQHLLRLCGRQTTNISNMSIERALQLKIPLPPLPEQKRIAAILDKADAIRRKRKQVLDLTDTFLRSTFLEMFGDPVTNPKGWNVKPSSELFSEKPRIGTTTPAKGSGYIVVRVGELGALDIATEKCGRVEISDKDFEKFNLLQGDIVIARAIGSKNQLGKSSYFDSHDEPIVIDSHVMRLRTDKSICDPFWFYNLLSTPEGKILLQKAGGETAVQFNINATQASSLQIPLPPLSLQKTFSKISRKLTDRKRRQEQAKQHAENLFSSLQQKAFKGDL